MENILVEDWMNQKHWAYVVMSRVCTMAGLKLRRRLPEDLSQFEPDPGINTLLRSLDRVKPDMLSESERAEMCLDDAEMGTWQF